MKASTILQTAILITLVALAASCRTSRTIPNDYPNSKRYPYPEDRRYPYPGDDRKVVVVINDPNPNNLPPGQAKKIYGSKSARPYAPGQRKKQQYEYRRIPLIIFRTPDIVIGRSNDGRYYHRNSEGWTYWQGYDNRFYLDEQYLRKIKYDDKEYKDWYNKGKDKAENNNSKGRGKSKGNGHGKGHH